MLVRVFLGTGASFGSITNLETTANRKKPALMTDHRCTQSNPWQSALTTHFIYDVLLCDKISRNLSSP